MIEGLFNSICKLVSPEPKKIDDKGKLPEDSTQIIPNKKCQSGG